jgi:hypothetical protein
MLGLYDIAILHQKIDAGSYGRMSAPLSVEKDAKFVGLLNDHASKFSTLNGLRQGTVGKVLGRCFGQPLDG